MRPVGMGPSSRFAQIRIGSTSPPRRIPLTEWPFRLRMIEARIGYPEHFAQHRELTGTRAPGLASGRPVLRDNLDETGATIWMRRGGRADQSLTLALVLARL